MHATGEKTIDSATWRAERATLELYICARMLRGQRLQPWGQQRLHSLLCCRYRRAHTLAIIHHVP